MEKTTRISTSKGRLDVVLSLLCELSRSQCKKMIVKGQVLVNSKAVFSPSFEVNIGDEISYDMVLEKKEIIPSKEDCDIRFVYKDEDIAVIDKERGMVVHPAAGHHDDTLLNHLVKDESFDFEKDDESGRPGIVHRIDKDTSGLLLVAFNQKSMSFLQEEIRMGEVHRKYLALCEGRVDDLLFQVDAPLTRPNHTTRRALVDLEKGRRAVTHFKTLSRNDKCSLLLCTLETGRTHQIRAHMQFLNHPIVGDEVYSRRRYPFADKGQCLHACSLSFIHPVTLERMTFYSPLDEYMKKAIRELY